MRNLWLAFVGVMVVSFLILGWSGTRIYQEMPPLPDRVITADTVFFLGAVPLVVFVAGLKTGRSFQGTDSR
jgi:nitric oxide reductase large subunit